MIIVSHRRYPPPLDTPRHHGAGRPGGRGIRLRHRRDHAGRGAARHRRGSAGQRGHRGHAAGQLCAGRRGGHRALVRWTAAWPRRRALLFTLLSLTVSQLISALAPTFAVLALGRVLCSLTHGLMWSVIAPIAVRLVPPSHAARATAAVYVGTGLALVVGNPLTAAMSEVWGWRLAVGAITVAALAVTVAARFTLPAMPLTQSPVATRPGRVRPHRNRGLVTLSVLTLVGVTGHFISLHVHRGDHSRRRRGPWSAPGVAAGRLRHRRPDGDGTAGAPGRSPSQGRDRRLPVRAGVRLRGAGRPRLRRAARSGRCSPAWRPSSCGAPRQPRCPAAAVRGHAALPG